MLEKTFADLGLAQDTLESLERIGFSRPTPIQQKAIMPIMMGLDLLACAQTGSGKTASFVLPIIDILTHTRARARMARVLVLEPTRELAVQVAQNVTLMTEGKPLVCATLVGGMGMNDQIRQLRAGVDILISTPGRLIDLIERGSLVMGDIQTVVIDEADRMLDMGFIPDVRRILGFLRAHVQTLLFSATMPNEIKVLSSEFLKNPKEVYVDPPSMSAASILHHFVATNKASDRIDQLDRLLDLDSQSLHSGDPDNDKAVKEMQAVVFCNRKADIGFVKRSIAKIQPNVMELHGDMPQPQRLVALESFRDNKTKILVCSDVAARGLDIPGIDKVINYDVPMSAEDYVHRVGRTGRAGRKGKAYTLFNTSNLSDLAHLVSVVPQDKTEIEGVNILPQGVVDVATLFAKAQEESEQDASLPKKRSTRSKTKTKRISDPPPIPPEQTSKSPKREKKNLPSNHDQNPLPRKKRTADSTNRLGTDELPAFLHRPATRSVDGLSDQKPHEEAPSSEENTAKPRRRIRNRKKPLNRQEPSVSPSQNEPEKTSINTD